MSRRRLRIVWEPEDGTKPWVVQYDTPTPRQWTDVLRFTQYAQATEYVRTIRRRDRALLEAER
jgi:hypothetical protein